jgi:peptidoglycan/LPS O-acetylase OafA/YrhL
MTTTAPTATVAATGTGAAGESGLAYRPALDGVRALAVYLVLAFHAGLALGSGAFIGVDVFFVLSGYLVTSLIVTGLAEGRFRLADFYGRRVRRLLPAALVVLTVVAVLWLAIAAPLDRARAAGDVRAAALYVSNWHFADIAMDYFAANTTPSPVLHFWSLSVEEQFYLAWPLLVLAAWRLGRRSGDDQRSAARRLGLLILVLLVASVAILVWLVWHGQTALAYYGTHARAYQLLAGALLAVGLRCWHWAERGGRVLAGCARVLPLAGLLALLALASDRIAMEPAVRGIGAAVAATTLLLGLELRPAGAAARLFGAAPVRYLGQISYATYLWHYPVILAIRQFVEISPKVLLVTGGLVATGLAALSQPLLEQPIRRSRRLARHARPVIAAGLAASALLGVVLLPPVLHSGRPPVVRVAETGVSGPEPRLPLRGFDIAEASRITPGTAADGRQPPDTSCTRVAVTECIVVRGPGKRVLLLGDSHAGMLLPPFRAIARQEGLTLALARQTGCPWHRTLVFTRSDHQVCQRVKDIWYSRVIPQFNPDVIVLVSRATDHVVGSSYPVQSVDPRLAGATQSELLAQAAEQTVRQLAVAGRTVVIVEPVPVSPTIVSSCVGTAEYADQCAFLADDTPSPAELAYRALARRLPGVHAVDIDRLTCPRLPVCDAVVAGTLVRSDHDHLTPRYSATITAQLEMLLRASGAL